MPTHESVQRVSKWEFLPALGRNTCARDNISMDFLEILVWLNTIQPLACHNFQTGRGIVGFPFLFLPVTQNLHLYLSKSGVNSGSPHVFFIWAKIKKKPFRYYKLKHREKYLWTSVPFSSLKFFSGNKNEIFSIFEKWKGFFSICKENLWKN